MSDTNIHPIFDRLLGRKEKESLHNQTAKVIWMTGLSGSGKSTVAIALEKMLHSEGYHTMVLDGDNTRTGICNNLGFSLEDRAENIRRIAEVSKLFAQAGIVCINSFVSPTIAIRQTAKEIIGEDDFLEIYVSAPIEVCESRDVKGLYAKARAGEIKGFTGIDSPYEAPVDPFLEVKTDKETLEESVNNVYNKIKPFIGKH
jgi:adenylylsulfate kinase